MVEYFQYMVKRTSTPKGHSSCEGNPFHPGKRKGRWAYHRSWEEDEAAVCVSCCLGSVLREPSSAHHFSLPTSQRARSLREQATHHPVSSSRSSCGCETQPNGGHMLVRAMPIHQAQVTWPRSILTPLPTLSTELTTPILCHKRVEAATPLFPG